MNFNPLSRLEMKQAIEGKGAPRRVPMTYHFWLSPDVFAQRKPDVVQLMNTYPMDVQNIIFNMPKVYEHAEDDSGYRWMIHDDPMPERHSGLDERVAISDFDELDDILADFPSPRYPGLLPNNPPDDGRYRLGYWWYWLFERHWELRGMTNALTDYYDDPDNVHRLFRALTDFYLAVIERAHAELHLDGIMISDDLGTQTGPFFSKAVFTEFFKPYYREIIDKVHSLGMHFWLHACGNIELFLPDLIEIGLDVIHPIQKHTMDEKQIAGAFGHQICVWSGFDVQRTIPYGSPQDVRDEVRFLIDTYYRTDGRLILTAGNGITADCPLDSLKALFDESFTYGQQKTGPDQTDSQD